MFFYYCIYHRQDPETETSPVQKMNVKQRLSTETLSRDKPWRERLRDEYYYYPTSSQGQLTEAITSWSAAVHERQGYIYPPCLPLTLCLLSGRLLL